MLPESTRTWRFVGLAAAGCLLTIPFWVLALNPGTAAGSGRHVVLFAWAFGAFLLALGVVWLTRARDAAGQQPRMSLPLLVLVLAFAAFFRAPLIARPPARSTDIYRCLWEGKLLKHGLNPFSYAPDDPRLDWLHANTATDRQNELYHRRINNKDRSAIYPGFSQAMFLLASYVREDGIVALKLVYLAFDLACACFLVGLLRALGRDEAWTLMWAWHPLVVTEFSGAAHQDVMGIALLVLALWLLYAPGIRRRPLWAGIAAGLSIAAKGYTVFLLPFMWRRFGGEGRAARGPLAFMAAVVATDVMLTLPFLSAGQGLLRSLGAYATIWDRNASLYYIFDGALQLVTERHDFGARVLGMALTLIFMGYLYYLLPPARRPRQAMGKMLAALGAFLLLAPVTYPWYVCWTIPLVVVAFSPSWFLFTGLVALDYLHRYYDAELPSVLLGQYLPVYVGLAIEWWLWRRKRRAAAPP
ncbi:MAG: hypothetical protein ACE5R4_16900 [Armatimonadota bacterium]